MDNPDIEIRCGFYGGLLVTSEILKIQRENLEMEQHYHQMQDDHDTRILLMKLQAANLGYSPVIWPSFALITLIVLICLISLYLIKFVGL